MLCRCLGLDSLITLATMGGVTVEGAKASATDILADNGVIDVIDSVIIAR